MSILVIGGTGFIGPTRHQASGRAGEDICMDINPGGASCAGLEDQVTVIRGDVTQFEDVMRVAIETKPERVINLSSPPGRWRGGTPPSATAKYTGDGQLF